MAVFIESKGKKTDSIFRSYTKLPTHGSGLINQSIVIFIYVLNTLKFSSGDVIPHPKMDQEQFL